MLRFLWPMKEANDASFRFSNKTKTIYDDVSEMPEHDFDWELKSYQQLRWKRGILQQMIPTVSYGAIGGFLYGLYESRRGLVRHTNRFKIITNSMQSAVGLSLCIASSHQLLLMASDYRGSLSQCTMASVIGAGMFTMMHGGGITAVGRMSFSASFVYTIANLIATKYIETSVTNFMATQQMNDVPITKVTPEMQRMYRAWLWDHRPIEDLDTARREALVLDRTADDTRLDAAVFSKAISIENLDWFPEFPVWWPIKLAPKSEKAAIVEKRMRDDAYERRKMAMLENQIMFSHPMRTATGSNLSDSTLDLPSNRD